MKSSYKTGSPFPRLNSLEERKEYLNRNYPTDTNMMDDIRKDVVDFSGYRGKDTFKKSLQQGPSSNVDKAFEKNKRDSYGNKNKYPYLSSRFLVNPDVKDPFSRGRRDDMNTIRDQERVLQQTRAKRGISGPPKLLEDYETSAQVSSRIGDDLLRAQELGDEQGMSQAMFDAQRITQADKMLNTGNISKRPKPGEKFGDEFTGDYIDGVAYKNARMLDDFNRARVAGVSAQNLSDFARQSDERMRYFDPSEGLGDRDQRTGEYKINFGGQ